MAPKSRIRVYAGIGFDKHGNGIDQRTKDLAIGDIQAYCSSAFGGCTIYPHVGSWLDNGETTTESGITVEVLAPRFSNPRGQELAIMVRESLSQKSVVLTIEEVPVRFV